MPITLAFAPLPHQISEYAHRINHDIIDFLNLLFQGGPRHYRLITGHEGKNASLQLQAN